MKNCLNVQEDFVSLFLLPSAPVEAHRSLAVKSRMAVVSILASGTSLTHFLVSEMKKNKRQLRWMGFRSDSGLEMNARLIKNTELMRGRNVKTTTGTLIYHIAYVTTHTWHYNGTKDWIIVHLQCKRTECKQNKLQLFLSSHFSGHIEMTSPLDQLQKQIAFVLQYFINPTREPWTALERSWKYSHYQEHLICFS